MTKKYLIDVEINGTLVIEAASPQAAASKANAVIRAVTDG